MLLKTLNLKRFLLFIDFLSFNLSLLLSFLFIEAETADLLMALAAGNLIVLFTVTVLIKEEYPENTRISEKIISALKKSILISFLFFLLGYVMLNYQEDRISFFVFASSHIISLVLFKGLSVYFIKLLRSKGYLSKKIIIAGYGSSAREFMDIINYNKDFGYKIEAIFDDRQTDNEIVDMHDVNELRSYCLKNNIYGIFCFSTHLHQKKIEEIVDLSNDLPFNLWVVPNYQGFYNKNYQVQQIEHIPLIHIKPTPLEEPINAFIKRSFDVIFSLLSIVFVLWWIVLLFSLLIKIESRGPVFFIQKRTGMGGRIFNCYKLRTMKVNPYCDIWGAKKNDYRITRMGHFLRKTSLDEFPQFLNVFLGDMSIVGPRPHMIAHTEKYSPIIEKYMFRHKIKPGITGLAQVKGYRGRTEEDSYAMFGRVRLDRFYIKNWSFLLDLRILFLTFVTLIKADDNVY